MASSRNSHIYVIAGVNGAGKSSIGGAAFRAFGADYFNPDEIARAMLLANPGLSQRDANGVAWRQGRSMLEKAIAERLDFALETTLGGGTIPRLLAQAASGGAAVHVWYIGLATAELHLQRVRARVYKGGHDIAEVDIRRRFQHSRLNLIQLLPQLTALRVFDNSEEADPASGALPAPKVVLEMNRAKIIGPKNLTHTPDWAKPIVAAALKLAEH